MEHTFYLGFSQVPYPCFWLARDGNFWHNEAAQEMPGTETAHIRALLGAALREQNERGTRQPARIADALQLGGITLLPTQEGLFAACPGKSVLPMQAFSTSLREPLTNIYAVLPLVAKKLEDSELRYVDAIQGNCYTLLRLAANLEAAGALSVGTRPRPVDLCALVESLCVCARSVCKEHGVEIHHRLPEEPLVVNIDPALMAQVFLNVLRNSLQYTRDGNEIVVRLMRAGGRAVLRVEDKGLGVKPEYLEHIFEPYFSQDPYGDGGTAPGLGLGLAVAAQLAQASGGTIAAESRFGEGTSITLALPMHTGEGEVLGSDPADYLLNRYSAVYVQLCGLCRLPAV